MRTAAQLGMAVEKSSAWNIPALPLVWLCLALVWSPLTVQGEAPVHLLSAELPSIGEGTFEA